MLIRGGAIGLFSMLVFTGGIYTTEVFASWWTKLGDAAGDAAKMVASKAELNANKMHSLLKIKEGASQRYALKTSNGRVLALDAAGKDIIVAGVASGALALTDEGIRLVRAGVMLIPEDELSKLSGFLEKVFADQLGGNIKVLRNDGSLGRVLTVQKNGKSVVLAETYPSVFTEVGGRNADELVWAFEQPLKVEKTRVISLMHRTDADILNSIDDVAGDMHIPSNDMSTASIIKTMKAQRQKNVFVIGHVEGDDFVVRDAAGNVDKKISIQMLEAAARDADATVFMLGCSAGLCSGTSGFIGSVNALDIASGLKEAIHQVSIGHALSALANNAGDILVRPSMIDSVRVSFVAEQRAKAIEEKAVKVMRVGTLTRERTQELAERIIPFIPTWIQFPYFAGWLFLVFSLRHILSEWAQFRTPAPRFGHRPLASLAVRGVRGVGFVLLMPFFALVLVMAVFMPWALSISSAIFASPIPIFISAFFGWKVWTVHAEEMEGDKWVRRFWPIVFFCSVITLFVETVTDPLMLMFLSHFPGEIDGFLGSINYQLVYWVFIGMVSLGASYSLFFILRRLKWNTVEILDWIFTFPLVLIEFFANFLIKKGRRHTDNE